MPRPRSKSNRHLPPGIHQKGKAFYLVKNGKWTPLGSDLKDALAKYADLVPVAVEPGRTFRDLTAQYLKTEYPKLRPATRESYSLAITNLLASFGDAPVHEITPAAIGRYMDLRTSIHSANREKAVLSKIMKLGIRWGWCDENPATKIEYHPVKRRRRIITPAEWSKIKLAATSDLVPLFMDLSFAIGIRVGDLLSLKWKDVHEDHIHVLQGKNQVEVNYQRTPALNSILERAKRLHGRSGKVRTLQRPDLTVIHKRNLDPYTYYGFRSIWRTTVLRAFPKEHESDPAPDIHIHDIRRTVITAVKQSGGRPVEFSQHKTESEAEEYVVLTPTVVPMDPEAWAKQGLKA